MKKLLLILVFINGCMYSEDSTPIIESTEYKMKVETVAKNFGWFIARTENDEVICYVYDGDRAGGMQCKWK